MTSSPELQKRGESEDPGWGDTIPKTKRALKIWATSIEMRGKVGIAWVRNHTLTTMARPWQVWKQPKRYWGYLGEVKTNQTRSYRPAFIS